MRLNGRCKKKVDKKKKKIRKTILKIQKSADAMTSQLKYPFIDGCENLPNDKVEDIKYLKDWMSTQPHLPKISGKANHLASLQ